MYDGYREGCIVHVQRIRGLLVFHHLDSCEYMYIIYKVKRFVMLIEKDVQWKEDCDGCNSFIFSCGRVLCSE
jgi:hypothetical protein